MRITSEEVRKVANLARLALSEEEVQSLTLQLDAILGYVEQLNELDTTAAEPTTHVIPLDCPPREDCLKPFSGREAILNQAPQHEEDFFLVPKIIE